MTKWAEREWPLHWRLENELRDLAISLDMFLTFHATKLAETGNLAAYDIHPTFLRFALLRGVLQSATHTSSTLREAAGMSVPTETNEDLCRQLRGCTQRPKGTP